MNPKENSEQTQAPNFKNLVDRLLAGSGVLKARGRYYRIFTHFLDPGLSPNCLQVIARDALDQQNPERFKIRVDQMGELSQTRFHGLPVFNRGEDIDFFCSLQDQSEWEEISQWRALFYELALESLPEGVVKGARRYRKVLERMLIDHIASLPVGNSRQIDHK